MKLSSQEEYGLRCLLQVSLQQARGPVSIRSVADAEGLSLEYTAKLLRILRQGELVHSTRGATGGYVLTAAPSEITVWRAIEVLDTPMYSDEFCAGHKGQLTSCVHNGTSCSIRVLWQWVDSSVRRTLERVTLADLARGVAPVRTVLQETA